jgi:hypothetical protein
MCLRLESWLQARPPPRPQPRQQGVRQGHCPSGCGPSRPLHQQPSSQRRRLRLRSQRLRHQSQPGLRLGPLLRYLRLGGRRLPPRERLLLGPLLPAPRAVPHPVVLHAHPGPQLAAFHAPQAHGLLLAVLPGQAAGRPLQVPPVPQPEQALRVRRLAVARPGLVAQLALAPHRVPVAPDVRAPAELHAARRGQEPAPPGGPRGLAGAHATGHAGQSLSFAARA